MVERRLRRFSILASLPLPMSNAVKVLIVEDEPHALMGLAELISGWGYRTETARDGIEGWDKILAWSPSIVVTDLKMPRLDGIGLLARLGEEGPNFKTNVAVVLLTAQGSIQIAVDAMKLGAYDFLLKPVDATRLRNILANATRQRETGGEDQGGVSHGEGSGRHFPHAGTAETTPLRRMAGDCYGWDCRR